MAKRSRRTTRSGCKPSGSHDAYNTGDIVRYNGVLYRSKIDGNTWAPDAYPDGWEALE